MAELDQTVKRALEKADITHTVFACNPEWADTATFCQHYPFTEDQSANTILVASKKVEPTKYAACVALATTRLDVNKRVCQLLDIKRASFASAEQTTRLTGMMIGGVTVFGLPKDIPIYIDARVMDQPIIIMGGGNRSNKIILKPQELKKLPNVEVIKNLAFGS